MHLIPPSEFLIGYQSGLNAPRNDPREAMIRKKLG